MAPFGYCFGAAGEAIGGGSFASLLLVGTAPAMKAPTTGMLTHQGRPVRAAGLARVWAFPSRVGAMRDQPREKLLDVLTFSSLSPKLVAEVGKSRSRTSCGRGARACLSSRRVFSRVMHRWRQRAEFQVNHFFPAV